MKTCYTYTLILLSLFVFSFTSCKRYISLSNASKVSQLSENPFMFNLAKSMLKNTGNYMLEQGLKSTTGKINLMTPLVSIISSPDKISGFTTMLSNLYKIPNGKLAKAYSSFSTVKDLIYFVANNGKSFNFYSN